VPYLGIWFDVIHVHTLTEFRPSNAYPTELRPAGFTFSIWGLIFLLQGGGTAIMMMNKGDPAVTSAVAAGWFATWMLQNLWVVVFLTAPVPRKGLVTLEPIT
jgi:hypothetical protein